ncbi:hypothetical protein D9757_003312 [Collybiopsis confluens]|uniref:Uncharacterized protein n=1 Tax=Collybiopsis confluens TaxID=2823264 RepID=A0A8H5MF27_9AGAR|nr:hypothetical protein D9757_003312 [Collybiopsis confluens]
MVQFNNFLLSLILVSSSYYGTAAPLGSRQIGDLQCNIARLKTVSGLSATNKAVSALSSSSGSDPAIASAVSQAQSGIQSAQSGISTIAKAILTSQDAPAAARDQVGSGLATVQSALDSIGNSTDPNLQAAQSALGDTIIAGQQVVSDCGGGSGAAAASAAPNAKRQVGDLQCNIARLKTVSSLAATTKSVQEIASAAGSDAATSSAAQAAASGLSTAKSGISQIAKALVAGQNAPASGRDQVGQGLIAAQNALNSITSTDPTVSAALSQAQTDLGNTISAGQQVSTDCTPTGGSAATTTKRQVGDLQCNIARLKAVSSLSASQKNVQAIGKVAQYDAAVSAAVQNAQTGIASAQAGISAIAQALAKGQLAPASGRDQVNQGVGSAQSALSGITSTNPAVTSAVATAQSSLTDTLNASAQVAMKLFVAMYLKLDGRLVWDINSTSYGFGQIGEFECTKLKVVD